jgi:hypothetical protein
MTQLDERTFANMDVALEKIFQGFPHGGDHEHRKYVAAKLLNAARRGNTSLGGLDVVAKRALADLSKVSA